jgi:hypothetical protein
MLYGITNQHVWFTCIYKFTYSLKLCFSALIKFPSDSVLSSIPPETPPQQHLLPHHDIHDRKQRRTPEPYTSLLPNSIGLGNGLPLWV